MSITKSALVTGATGFIGSHLVQRLLQEGWRVKVLVRNAEKLNSSIRENTEIIVGDLGNNEALKQAVENVEVIFHCAANVHTWDSWENYYAANVVGVRNLLETIAQHNSQLARLVHVSSVDVYGFPLQPCDEQTPTQNAGFGYGESKRQGENLVREFGEKHGLSYTILRPTNVIGEGSSFIIRIGEELRNGLMLTIDKGQINAGLIYIKNLLDAFLWAATAEVAHRGCYNVNDDLEITWAEFLHTFKQAINGKGLIINLPFSIAEIAAYGCEMFYRLLLPKTEPLLHRLIVRIFGRTCAHSAKKLRADSGLTVKVDYKEAMERSCQWWLAQAKNNQ